jgi:hypothetical protein
MDENTINDILGQMGMQEASPNTRQRNFDKIVNDLNQNDPNFTPHTVNSNS